MARLTFVGHGRRAGFGGDVRKASGSEVGRTHPSLDGPEDVQRRTS
jgi:hypothetical protein